MKLLSMVSRVGLRGTRKVAEILQSSEQKTLCRVVGWTSAALCIAALGLYAGHELRSRYRFRHRTPYDIFAHAGDSVRAADYGVGI